MEEYEVDSNQIFTQISEGTLTVEQVRKALEKKQLGEVNEEIPFYFFLLMVILPIFGQPVKEKSIYYNFSNKQVTHKRQLAIMVRMFYI